MEDKRVLIVENSAAMRGYLSEMVKTLGLEPDSVDGKGSLCSYLDRQEPDLLLCGSSIAEREMGMLAEIANRGDRNLPIVFIRKKQGSRPEAEMPDTVCALLHNFQPPELRQAIESLIVRIRSPRLKALDEDIVGRTPPVIRMKHHILRLAGSDLTVLITGESGTGKELVARAIHRFSPREKSPFVKVNSACVPNHLFESELFGFEKGAFTGALKNKPGKFELARRGTFFLDEIGEIPLPMQAKLLQVLEDHEVSPLGSTTTKKIDARVVAATNADLNQLISRQKFRSDLYYRLSVATITVPPLRDRKEDIPALCDYFLRKYTTHYGKELCELSKETLQGFGRYDWPGNIRELENAVRYMVAVGKETLPPTIQQRQGFQTTDRSLKEASRKAVRQAEKDAITEALFFTSWNRKKAAALLRTSYRTILNKMKEYDIRERTADTAPC
jgi:two-component system response regulator AtoC